MAGPAHRQQGPEASFLAAPLAERDLDGDPVHRLEGAVAVVRLDDSPGKLVGVGHPQRRSVMAHRPEARRRRRAAAEQQAEQ